MMTSLFGKILFNTAKIGIIALAVSLFICVGCGQKNSPKPISAELILNPNTAEKPASNDELPQISFDKTTHDFGLIIQGEMVEYVFKFKNIGNSDLIINNVSSSCGCTVPKFPKEPISPGKEGEIEVVFNSANRSGQQVKTITVWSNCQPNQTELQITSQIIIPKQKM